MLRLSEIRSLKPDELHYKKRALRDAVICIGWLKLLSVICYVILFMMTHIYSKGQVISIILVMIVIVIPLQIINGVLLFLGALERKSLAIYISLWLIIISSLYNTIIGAVGCIYYIRNGQEPIHFILAVVYFFLIFSLFTVLFHDVIVIYTYRKMLEPRPCGCIDN